MEIINGTLSSAAQELTKNHSGEIDPTKVVVHFTGGIHGDRTVSWFRNPRSDASTHFVIHRAGNITQMVNTRVKAWHAGRSKWNGMWSLNGFSIGIELVNAGLLDTRDGGEDTTYFTRMTGEAILDRDVELSDGKAWHKYSQSQILSLIDLIKALKRQHPNIDELLGHENVAPRRKIDPGPLFPWKKVSRETQLGYNGRAGESHFYPRPVKPPTQKQFMSFLHSLYTDWLLEQGNKDRPEQG